MSAVCPLVSVFPRRGVGEQNNGFNEPHTAATVATVAELGERLARTVGVFPHLDHHHLYRHVLRQPYGSQEVHGKGHQQVDDGHQVFRMDSCKEQPEEGTIGCLSCISSQPKTTFHDKI